MSPRKLFHLRTQAKSAAGIELWNNGLESVIPEEVGRAIYHYEVDVNTPLVGMDEHPLVSFLRRNESLFIQRRFTNSVKEMFQDEHYGRFFNILDMILHERPDLLAKKDGMTVADQVISPYNAFASAKIILTAIQQSIEREQFMASIGQGKKLENRIYHFNMNAIFNSQAISPDSPNLAADSVAALKCAHDRVRDLLNKAESIFAEELMTLYEAHLGYWLQPFVAPEKAYPAQQARPSPV